MSRSEVGRLIVGVGAFLVLLGLVTWAGGLDWFGRLPGDIRLERGTVRVYVPVVSMLLISIALSLLLSVVRRLL
jgi:hypothetical protein